MLEVKRAYGLTVDRREAAALERVIRGYTNTNMEALVCCHAETGASTETGVSGDSAGDVLAKDGDNGNGRTTGNEIRRPGVPSIHRPHSVYRYMRDGDGDGVVWESRSA